MTCVISIYNTERNNALIYWNQKRHYRLLSSKDRDLYMEEMSPMYFRKWMKRVNLVLNIITPLLLYFYIHLPLRELAFAFIAFDILLNVFEQIVFITLPWAVSKVPLIPIAQWQYRGISRNLSKTEDRIDFLRKKHCETCDGSVRGYKITCTRCKTMQALVRKKDRLTESQRAAKDRLDILITKRDGTISKAVKTTTTTPAKPEPPSDNTLATYFHNISAECNKLIDTHRFDFLIAVRKSTESLTSILKNKPEGETEIPGTLCYRLENLLKLLHCLHAESDDARSVYLEDAKAAASTINEELQQTIMKIQKLLPGVDTNTPEMLLAKTKLAKENDNV